VRSFYSSFSLIIQLAQSGSMMPISTSQLLGWKNGVGGITGNMPVAERFLKHVSARGCWLITVPTSQTSVSVSYRKAILRHPLMYGSTPRLIYLLHAHHRHRTWIYVNSSSTSDSPTLGSRVLRGHHAFILGGPFQRARMAHHYRQHRGRSWLAHGRTPAS
jgi:hypothetical protein